MESDLERRLRAHSEYFVSMFSMVPAQYRTTREEDDLVEAVGGKETRFWHLKKGAGPPAKLKKKQSEPDADESVANREETGVGVEEKRSLSLSELRKRLHEKIEEVSSAKKDKESDEGLRKRRKRRRERGEGGPDKKQQRLEEKKKRRDAVRKEKEVQQKKVAVSVSRDQVSDESLSGPQFSFNRFEFNEPVKTGTKKKSNYKALIAKAEGKQRKLQELVEQDEERGEAAADKEKWSKALLMARGEKVRDDPSLLRKTVKRLEKKKQGHVKKWRERVKAEQQRQETRQRKRQQNIRDRIDKIKAKKTRKRAKKRGFV